MSLRYEDLHNTGALILAQGIPAVESARRELSSSVEEWLQKSDAAPMQSLPKYKREAISFLGPQLRLMLGELKKPAEVE